MRRKRLDLAMRRKRLGAPLRRTSPRVLAAAFAAICAIAAVAGCASSGGGGGGGGGATSTVSIGFFDPSIGPTASPGAATGEKAALTYINQALGGLNGHKIAVIDCPVDSSSSSTISCANNFVSRHVIAAVDGFDLASSAALPILTPAGIPMIGMIPYDSVTGGKAENRVYFGAAQAAYLVGALQAFQHDGKKSATLVMVETPASHQTIELVLKPVGAALGVKVTGLYFSATHPDFTTLSAQIVASKPDVAGLVATLDEATCSSLVQGLRSAGYRGTVLVAACTRYIKQLPAQAANSALYSSVWLPAASSYAPPATQTELATTTRYLGGVAGGTEDYYSYATFATFVDLAKGLQTAPKVQLTGPNVLSTLQALKNFPSYLGPTITCGKPTSPNCTTQMLLFDVQKNGTAKPVTGGFITALPTVLAKIQGAS